MPIKIFLKLIWNLPYVMYLKLRMTIVVLIYGNNSEEAEKQINKLIKNKLNDEKVRLFIKTTNCLSVILYSVTNDKPSSGTPVCAERYTFVSQYGIFRNERERELYISLIESTKNKNEKAFYKRISEWIRQYQNEDDFYKAYIDCKENNKQYDSIMLEAIKDILTTEEVAFLGNNGITNKFGHMFK